LLYVGIDYHKRYSQLDAIGEDGRSRAQGRMPNELERVSEFFASLGEPCRVVLEAGWNWGLMYDWLESIENVEAVELAHPYRVRAIAAAEVKTDSIDAHTLGQLLRANLIPRAYIPQPQTRQLREVVRQRMFLVRVRTMVKNRIHALLDRHHVPAPAVSDLFGKRGRQYLHAVELPKPERQMLSQDTALVESLNAEIAATEKWLREALRGDRRVEILRTIPGIGDLLATVFALEIDRIERFPTHAKLAAYAGMVPTVHSSGGRTFHGKLVRQRNKWLRWAAIEAAWMAVRLDPYFRTHFVARQRRKGSQTAIVATARRLLEIIWHVLKEDRPYHPHATPQPVLALENSSTALTAT